MLAQHIPHDPDLSIVDSFPVPVCRFARATYSRSFREVATYGYDEVARHIYYGLRAHVRLAWPGVLAGCALAPAHVSDTERAEELLQGVAGYVLADRNYWKPELSQRLKSYGLYPLLLTNLLNMRSNLIHVISLTCATAFKRFLDSSWSASMRNGLGLEISGI